MSLTFGTGVQYYSVLPRECKEVWVKQVRRREFTCSIYIPICIPWGPFRLSSLSFDLVGQPGGRVFLLPSLILAVLFSQFFYSWKSSYRVGPRGILVYMHVGQLLYHTNWRIPEVLSKFSVSMHLSFSKHANCSVLHCCSPTIKICGEFRSQRGGQICAKNLRVKKRIKNDGLLFLLISRLVLQVQSSPAVCRVYHSFGRHLQRLITPVR